jgi:hypothetical protein
MSLSRQLREKYPDHPLIIEAADKIDHLEKQLKDAHAALISCEHISGELMEINMRLHSAHHKPEENKS